MAHQAQSPPGARLQQRPRIAARSQADLLHHRRRQTSCHANFSGLQRPSQGAAQQEITVKLQAAQLRRHRLSALTAFSRESPLLIRAIKMAILGDAMAPQQQFTLSRFALNWFRFCHSRHPNSRRALRCRLASGSASQPRLKFCTAGASGWPARADNSCQVLQRCSKGWALPAAIAHCKGA